jgi:hypothetical protein
VDPDFFSIPDPDPRTKKQGETFETVDKEIKYFYTKFFLTNLKNMSWGSGTQKKLVPDPYQRVKKAQYPHPQH